MEHQSNERRDIAMTTATLSKWGNSSAIRIPNQLLKKLNLEEGAEIEILVTADNELLLRPVSKATESNEELRSHLKSLLSKVKDNKRHEEIDFGTEGNELL
ncbi:AbrB/MazE/SpoVT family DNA-binding domain-containing protein [Paenibacillus illinoisensis]|uniref:AbrB/MazE/SpoVT family DNA-binding domain-containing protein n=1 Tax=Paenibacillus illinoisensis TaxID=59845 RepID=UPI000FD949F7|nr:AbrB/MazE/SpoVT family DNA-binding domain-containing protein [Paenibacillus illinoisensis]